MADIYVLVNKRTGEEVLDLTEGDIDRIFGNNVTSITKTRLTFPFFKVNINSFKRVSELSGGELRAFVTLMYHLQQQTNFVMKKGKPYLKKNLEGDIGTSSQMARRYFKSLEKKGLIKKVKFNKTYWAINPDIVARSESVYTNIMNEFGGEDETHSI